VRYIGNKTKLLDFIGSVLDQTGVRDGRALDAFSGTASVGSYLKARGFEVTSCDLMTYSLVFQKAYIEIDAVPDFRGLLAGDPELRALRCTPAFRERLEQKCAAQTSLPEEQYAAYHGFLQVACYLEELLPPQTSFITQHYAPNNGEEPGDRMFFTRDNAQRIDAIRTKIHTWRLDGLLDDAEYYLLLSRLLEAADSVANTTGVYAAYVKSWQSNARRPIRLTVPTTVATDARGGRAIQGDVNDVIGSVGELALLYLDPPYNTRQYSAYYHVPELIAKGWFDEEPELRGKTGLIADADKRSRWSSRRGCVRALEELLSRANARHVLMSYNSEGIIPEADIRRIFEERGEASTYRVFERDYGRYRSDRDHERRQYSADSVTEKLYYVRVDT
jgi:adenine-specific DNA-methyltransferase